MLIASRTKRILLAFIVLILLISIGFVGVYQLSKSNLHREVRNSLEVGKSLMDKLVKNADVASQRALPYTKMECEQALPYLRDLVVTIPDVQMIALAKDNHVFCGSLVGKRDYIVPNYHFSGDKLFLVSSLPDKPNTPALIFKNETGNTGVGVSVSGYYLKNILSLTLKDLDTYLQVGEKWINKAGQISDQPLPVTIQVESKDYPYRLQVSLFHDDYVNYLLSHKRSTIFIIILFALSMSWLIFVATGQTPSMEDKLRQALANNEFVPYVQPYVDKTNKFVGFEVLVRWLSPKEGLIRPDLFIPLAEDSGLIIPMTKSLMHQVSNELVAFSQSLPPDFSVAFNISAKHCVNSELLENSLEFLSSFPEKKVQLCLELTERELVRDTDEARALFHSLSEHDVSLAIDDFGTGHSSLSYLRQFRFDILKIDQSFVQMIGNDSVSAHIVENLLDLASRLGMKTIAEGVETAEQAEYLRSHNIDCLQGYYFAKPMPLKDFIQQLEQN